jgi:membrane protein
MANAVVTIFREALAVLRIATRTFFTKEARFHSAAIAFYALASLVPLSYFSLWIAGLFVSQNAAREALEGQLVAQLGPKLAHAISQWVSVAQESHASGFFSFLVLTYSATRLFAALERGVNAMWGLYDERTHQKQLVSRLLSFLIAAVVGLALAGLVASRSLAAMVPSSWFREELSPLAEWLGSLGLVFVIFFLLYLVLPAKRPRWRDALGGAAFSSVLFVVGTQLVTLYVAHKDGFGFGETMLLLLWMRYAAQVFLLGAAIVDAYLDRKNAAVASSLPVSINPT